MILNMSSSEQPPNFTEAREKLAQEIVAAFLPHPRIASEGWPRTILLGGLSIVSMALAWRSQGLPARVYKISSRLLAAAAATTAAAYRNPQREPLGNAPDYFYSPVDGTVELVEKLENEPQYISGPAYRLRIRSHLLDVPILRAPLGGRITYIHRRRNVAAKLGFDTAAGRLLITFLRNPHTWLRLPFPLSAATTINIRPEAGQKLEVSQICGVRGFGQPLQTSLYLPYANVDILCRAGQHVQAGMSVVGRIKPGS